MASRISTTRASADREYLSFTQFLVNRDEELQRIARFTKREFTLADVQNEAYTLAHDLRDKEGDVVDFLDQTFQDKLIRRLRRYFDYKSEGNVRNAVKLDHWTSSDGSTDQVHPLLNRLSAAVSTDPLQAMLEQEEWSQQPAKNEPVEPNAHHSQASAYIRLLRHFENELPRLSRYLRISLSHCRRCCKKVRVLAQYQQNLGIHARSDDRDFMPKAWRRDFYERVPTQLTFAFVDEPMLWAQAANIITPTRSSTTRPTPHG